MSEYKYFTVEEFNCKCGCGYNSVKPDFLKRLDAARHISGVAYILNSGCRCIKHNANEGSESINHVEGRAADIKAADSRTRFKILEGLFQAGFTRIGINFEKGFIHVDNMDAVGAPPCVVWAY